MRTFPHQKRWIETELLPVVVYQVKNVCGANQLLCADPFRNGMLYLGEWTEGLWAINSEGQICADLSRDLPFDGKRAESKSVSALSVIKADLNREGQLYAGFIKEGLWKSVDFGKTWSKLFPIKADPFNANSVDIGGKTGQEIVIACEPLYWSPCPSAVWYSPDLGETWAEISDPALGALRWKGICFDKSSGAIHGITCGNGCFTAVRE
jgi:hypothetical protein